MGDDGFSFHGEGVWVWWEGPPTSPLSYEGIGMQNLVEEWDPSLRQGLAKGSRKLVTIPSTPTLQTEIRLKEVQVLVVLIKISMISYFYP